MSEDRQIPRDQIMFDAYVTIRKVAQDYNLEDRLNIPRVVFVGETSSGKSMLIQNFLRFPCAFSKSDVATRCPVLYRLRYNPDLTDGQILIKHPENIRKQEDLISHLRDVMEKIEKENGFSLQEYLVHIESNQYRDFEIVDVPGLIGGDKNDRNIEAVERITERYVRDPRFLIVQLKDSTQIAVNSTAAKRIRALCLLDPAPQGSMFPPRTDFENYVITIQTKFDLFMEKYREASDVNENLQKLDDYFHHRTFFVSMIVDGYNFERNTAEKNIQYLHELPALEEQRVNRWIQSMKKSNSNKETFDEKRFRPLIGINVVRNQIQEMWLQAFRSAIPQIHQVLRQLVQEYHLRYDTLLKTVEGKDFNSLRDLYQRFITEFRSTLAQYVSFRGETNCLFDFDTYSRTYPEIENEFNQWSRKHEFQWCAHQTAEQLSKAPSEQSLRSLTIPLAGVRHFERIRQVFYSMILQHNPPSCSQGWIESAQGTLYGVTVDNEDLEKGCRESLQVQISETFQMGLCWLTHIYVFLLEHFEQHVVEVLLNPTGDFASLSVGHAKFLSYVRLDYHKKTREMIRRAVEACRMSRHARMQYVSHGILHFLRVLAESIPPTISDSKTANNIRSNVNPKLLIFGPGKFLTGERNSESASYLPLVRSTTSEIYAAVRGLLLQDIIMYFHANVVCNIQRYDTEDVHTDLPRRIDRMSHEELARMTQIDYEQHATDLYRTHQTLTDLEKASFEIDYANRLLHSRLPSDFRSKEENSITIAQNDRNQRYQFAMKKINQYKNKQHESELNDQQSHDESQNTDEYRLKILSNDSQTCLNYLHELFSKHDLEDLKANFIGKEDFPKRHGKTTLTKRVFDSSQINDHNLSKMENEQSELHSPIYVDSKAQNIEDARSSRTIGLHLPPPQHDRPRDSVSRSSKRY